MAPGVLRPADAMMPNSSQTSDKTLVVSIGPKLSSKFQAQLKTALIYLILCFELGKILVPESMCIQYKYKNKNKIYNNIIKYNM